MANVVVGVGSSHTPQVSSGAETWPAHGERDSRTPSFVGFDGGDTTFDALLAAAPERVRKDVNPAVFADKYARAQAAIAAVAASLEAAKADVVVVVGDDQHELFGPRGNPAISLYLGDTLWDRGQSTERERRVPPDIQAARWAAHAEQPEPYPVAAGLSRHLAEALAVDDFDVTVFSEQDADLTLGHAFTFARLRLGVPASVPMVPVMVNTYYPPNVPGPGRCYALGQALRSAIEAWPGPERVGLVASGGLSHTLVNEELDARIVEGLRAHDASALAAIPRSYFRAGNSECLNWLVVGGALSDATFDLVEYIPGFRSLAGTGTGMAFASWSLG